MPYAAHRGLLALSAVFALTGCETPASSYVDDRSGVEANLEMCASIENFVRAPLDLDGTRRAWFYPFGTYADGNVDIYAPMGAIPSDEHSRAFYRNGVGQLTHYQVMPRLASTVSDCLRENDGFSRLEYDAPDDSFRASYRDRSSSRRIEVVATRQRSAFLVVAEDWDGDVAAEFGEMLELDDQNRD